MTGASLFLEGRHQHFPDKERILEPPPGVLPEEIESMNEDELHDLLRSYVRVIDGLNYTMALIEEALADYVSAPGVTLVKRIHYLGAQVAWTEAEITKRAKAMA